MQRKPGYILFFKQRTACIGMVILLVFVACALMADLISPFNPNSQDLAGRLRPPGWVDEKGSTHLFGTDALGRDVLSQVVYGSRISLIVGTASVAISGCIGVLFGLVSGFWGGTLDRIIMRLADVQLAIPFIIISLVVVAMLGATVTNIVIIFSITGWAAYSRTVRGSTLSAREMDYVLAARSIGCGRFRIIFHHILPNVMTPVIVLASFEMARMILSESALSFLGLSVPRPAITWGALLADGRQYLREAWWISTFPGLAIMVAVLGINFIGDGLRDYFDYRTRQL